jgi:hypothetical protein
MTRFFLSCQIFWIKYLIFNPKNLASVTHADARLVSDKKCPLRTPERAFCCNSLTMSYFHTGTRTIIGAESFHCPVRDGKEWYQLAMVIRHNFLLH